MGIQIMNGRGKRNKGAAGERELAGILKDHLGFEVKRNLGQARDGADDITIQKFRIEVKGQSKWNHAASLEKYQCWHTGGTGSLGGYA